MTIREDEEDEEEEHHGEESVLGTRIREQGRALSDRSQSQDATLGEAAVMKQDFGVFW